MPLLVSTPPHKQLPISVTRAKAWNGSGLSGVQGCTKGEKEGTMLFMTLLLSEHRDFKSLEVIDMFMACCRFDLGTADEMGLDILINALVCFSKE